MGTKITQVLGERDSRRDTWPRVLEENYKSFGESRTAMRHKRNGIWQPYTWKDYYTNVKYLALGLLSLGFKAGDKLLIVGDNAPQWYYAELASHANRGVSVGAYSDLSPDEVRYIARNSEAAFAVVQDQEQVDKLLEIKDDLPLLKRIIYWDYKGLTRYDNAILVPYHEVIQLGEKHEREYPGAFERNLRSGQPDDVCALVYTSGTTEAAPKPVLHTHKTMWANAEAYLRLDPWRENDNVVPSLPPAWITEQLMAIGCHLLSGAILNFCERPETQQQDTREIGPNVVFYEARLWEKQASDVQARILEADLVKRLALRLFMPVGYKMAELRYGRQRPGVVRRMLYGLANRLLFARMRDAIGLSKARICYNTGAILSADAFKFYRALDLPLKNLYGTTEGGALAGAANDDIRLETVGRVHEGTEVRIAESGEIGYRHRGVFVGYYKDPAKTAEVFRDGWFYSGDSGSITEDGHIVFLDRLKDVVEMNGGDRLAPQVIESRLRFSPFVKDAWVLAGPDKAYASAVVVIDYASVGRWAGQQRVGYRTFAELSQKPEVYRLIKSYIDKVNQDLPAGVRVRKFVNLHKEFDPEQGELTRTRKLRRASLQEHYQQVIDAIYRNETEVLIEVQTKNGNGQTGAASTTLSIKSIDGAE